MEDQCSPLNWAYYYQQEEGNGMDELKHSLLYATVELETTILSAREELARKDDEIMHLRALLSRTAKERDEALAKSQRLMLEKLLQQNHQNHQNRQNQAQIELTAAITTSNEEDQPIRGDSYTTGGLSSSDCDENNVIASPVPENPPEKAAGKPLPEKGKFLQAVMEAGPLLQTLLLAGPLPQWQHPPPQLSAVDIPPVTISASPRLLRHQDSCLSTAGSTSKKRVISGDSCCSPGSKYQRVVYQ